MKSFQFHIIHAPQQPSLHSLLLLLLLLVLLCLPATPPCTGFAVEWRLHSLLLFLVFYVYFFFYNFCCILILHKWKIIIKTNNKMDAGEKVLMGVAAAVAAAATH